MAKDPSGPTNHADPPTLGRTHVFQVRFLGPDAADDGPTVGAERELGQRRSPTCGREGEPADPAFALLRVSEAEEELLVCRAVPAAGGGARATPELRLPLLLATASRPPANRRFVRIALPSPDELECLDGTQAAPGQARSRFHGSPQLPTGQSTFGFKCRSRSEAKSLLDCLSLAGCVVQDCFERYRMLKEVGHGGFGRVFKAKDSWTGDTVAVKLFYRKPCNAICHPLREAAMLRWCRDISLFPKFRSIQLLPRCEPSAGSEPSADGGGACRFAIVTEFVDAEELFEVLNRGPLPEACAKRIMRQILMGLGELHQRGIMHRDIKPENVMMTCAEVKLIDFGLACSEWDLESASLMVGSAGYIAPEMFARPSQAQTTRADCFGAGALLFHCLSGSGPFSDGDRGVVLRRNAACRVGVSALNAIPQGARSLILRLMRASPQERSTARQCLEDPWFADCPEVSPSADGTDVPTACPSSSFDESPTSKPSDSQSEADGRDGDGEEEEEQRRSEQLAAAGTPCSSVKGSLQSPVDGVSRRAEASAGDGRPRLPRLAVRLASLGAAAARAVSARRPGRSKSSRESSGREFHKVVPKP